MSISTLILYVGTWLVVALTPGPAVLCVMSQVARYGLRSAHRGVLGIQLGNFAFFVCIALGLVTLLMTTTNAFTALKVAGAGYLVYLGIGVVKASFRSSEHIVPRAPRPAGERGLVLQAFMVQVTNPKALLFVSALLPQFVDASQHMMLQLTLLMICTIVVDTVVLVCYAFLVERGMQSFRSSGFSRWIERAFGFALVALGLRLLAWRK
jgi:homoserine/homoserine lactone efflux protein